MRYTINPREDKDFYPEIPSPREIVAHKVTGICVAEAYRTTFSEWFRSVEDRLDKLAERIES